MFKTSLSLLGDMYLTPSIYVLHSLQEQFRGFQDFQDLTF